MDKLRQVDLILLDFAKAFDKVPHLCLLLKLSDYGLTSDILGFQGYNIIWQLVYIQMYPRKVMHIFSVQPFDPKPLFS